MKQELLNKIKVFKNKIVVEVNKIRKMDCREAYEYLINKVTSCSDDKKQSTKKDDVTFENKISDTAPEVVELINKFKIELELENDDSGESVDLVKKDLYTSLIDYINTKKSECIFPTSGDIENHFNISKRKRQELLKRACDDGHIIKINSTTYGFMEGIS